MSALKNLIGLFFAGALPGFLSCAAAAGPGSAPSATETGLLFYVSTSAKGTEQGIYAFRLDPAGGKLVSLGLAAGGLQSSFIAIDPSGRHLYAGRDVKAADGKSAPGTVVAFSIDDATGKLAWLNEQPSGGEYPCFVSMDTMGRFVLAANFNGGNVSVLPVLDGGRLGPLCALVQHHGSSVHPVLQVKAAPHAIYTDPANRYAVVPDLGADKIMIYRFDAKTGALTANQPAFYAAKIGSGPRHLAFHPSAKWAYVINELDGTIGAFDYDAAAGGLTLRQTLSTLPEGFTGNNSNAEVLVHPSGRFLYGSNRGSDTIAVCAIDSETGRLTRVQLVSTRGKAPTNFCLDPSGRWMVVANFQSNSLTLFQIDAVTGRLRPAGAPWPIPFPRCVKFAMGG